MLVASYPLRLKRSIAARSTAAWSWPGRPRRAGTAGSLTPEAWHRWARRSRRVTPEACGQPSAHRTEGSLDGQGAGHPPDGGDVVLAGQPLELDLPRVVERDVRAA